LKASADARDHPCVSINAASRNAIVVTLFCLGLGVLAAPHPADDARVSRRVRSTLDIALMKRNIAAHPNNVVLTPLQTEAYIEDLVNNAILKIV
jgi:hypothetical protein